MDEILGLRIALIAVSCLAVFMYFLYFKLLYDYNNLVMKYRKPQSSEREVR